VSAYGCTSDYYLALRVAVDVRNAAIAAAWHSLGEGEGYDAEHRAACAVYDAACTAAWLTFCAARRAGVEL